MGVRAHPSVFFPWGGRYGVFRAMEILFLEIGSFGHFLIFMRPENRVWGSNPPGGWWWSFFGFVFLLLFVFSFFGF